ncbi:hypothetical protein BP00DRAFT_419793 [Aspergillus indologenus CBS 114.80]|uniref:Uncharacterized protein n=1 Tax=Aspergillus indologenus CBS 114.80 TaxID=1450541 RepID=A0A2V5HRA7_9EURO|nr:hypothetical protein BP00DRAFT_419793 [Aspergillus indologenus CBS 114.80]
MMSKPWLLYAYPQQPFPRRVVIYVRARNIPLSIVTVVHVSDAQLGNKVPEGIPPQPPGRLSILAMPNPSSDRQPFIFVKQSIAIMEFFQGACIHGRYGFPKLPQPVALPINMSEIGDAANPGANEDGDAAAAAAAYALHTVRHNELLTLASA